MSTDHRSWKIKATQVLCWCRGPQVLVFWSAWCLPGPHRAAAPCMGVGCASFRESQGRACYSAVPGARPGVKAVTIPSKLSSKKAREPCVCTGSSVPTLHVGVHGFESQLHSALPLTSCSLGGGQGASSCLDPQHPCPRQDRLAQHRLSQAFGE